ncbi:C40 family peptidase [Sulfoacidibacillus thermotolerans]|uniref:NlpC/P60 domain-containing protein n=1 Tax=Sulfoacidibacillus thermotolerans TaxID=1765684 RepID=A0A2U3D9H0_SULT2|nr:SH3 domain-containing C40 family peptidase [Sulfoacidibacillus thermotolerans]PWI57912.1 hypothetical protein BM613_05710 [Sulfoacidibacillus thermotolerans]
MFIRLLREDYDEQTGIFTIRVQPIEVNNFAEFGAELGENSEDIANTDAPLGIVNYVIAKHPKQKMKWIHVVSGSALLLSIPLLQNSLAQTSTPYANIQQGTLLQVRHSVYLRSQPRLTDDLRIRRLQAGTTLSLIERIRPAWYKVSLPDGTIGYVVSHPYFIQATTSTLPLSNVEPIVAIPSYEMAIPPIQYSSIPSVVNSVDSLPPGITLDPMIHPLAPLSASRKEKVYAVKKVAESKLGIPYIWGHHEDAKQYGFDCSSFIEYVYHHALGYHFSTVSKIQAKYVGIPVSLDEMLPGDLLIFAVGQHVGIYVGEGQMIQAGGGLGKVGYLRVSPGSYWYKHLTAVKRMF